MTTGHVFIAASLDGFIARPDGGLDWLLKQETGAEDHGYEAFIARMDGVVMGSGSFRTARGFDPWPYTKSVVVLSRSLTAADIPEALAGKVRISALAPSALMASLAAEGWSRAYVDGGKVIQSFLREGLIAEMTLTHIPILIGAGIPLFGALPADIGLRHVKTKSFASGLVSSRYEVLSGG